MIVLDGTTESLVVTLGGANSHDFMAVVETIGPGQSPGQGQLVAVEVNVAVTTANSAIVAAPTAGTVKIIRELSVRNMTANSTTVALSKRVGSTNYAIGSTVTLTSGQSFKIDAEGRTWVYNLTGEKKADA